MGLFHKIRRTPGGSRLRIRLRRAGRLAGVLVGIGGGVLSGLLSSPAPAGPPFFTDDPVPVEKDHGELFMASSHTWSREGRSGTAPLFELDYGPAADLEIHVLAPFLYNRPNAPETTRYGYGDTELGFKWRPIHEDQLFKGAPQIGTAPLLELPTGDPSRGLGSGKPQGFLPLWLQKSWGQKDREWSTYGGGGYWINPGTGRKNYWFTGVVLQKKVADRLVLGGEVFHATPSAQAAPSHTGFNLGGVFDLSERWHLFASAGRDFHGGNQLTGYLGLQFTFGRSKPRNPAPPEKETTPPTAPKDTQAAAPDNKKNKPDQ